MIKLENVSKFYYNQGIVTTGFSKINLELKIGEFVIITGESGSGKSTLLNVISGLDSYEEGEMYIEGKKTSRYTEKEVENYRKKYIANIFQNFNLINSYTVYQNVELALLLDGYNKKQIKSKALQMIEQVGLTKFKNTKVSKLSGGQKQRVAIARAMIKDTPIIIADEPTGNLDSESAKNVIEILKKVAKEKLVIIVTHNLEQVEEYATRIIKMHDGKIIEDKKIKEINNNIEIKENKYKKMQLRNIYRLGIRNTVNIKTKFLLIFMIFFFIISSILLEYSNFKLKQHQETLVGTSLKFKDISENRILIKKKDKTSFTQEDYNKIKTIANIDYIVTNDLLIDAGVRIYRNSIYGNIEFPSSSVRDIKHFKSKLDLGRMPQADDEIIIQTSKLNYHVKTNLEEIIDKRYAIANYIEEDIIKNLKIVGIKYNENPEDNSTAIYMLNSKMEELITYVNKKYTTTIAYINDRHFSSIKIFPSDKVEKGNVIISKEWNEKVGKNVKGKNITIKVKNIYHENEQVFKIENIYSSNNFRNYTGYEQYQYYAGGIFINKEEYEKLYNMPNYQSSIYVKNVENIDKTLAQLDNENNVITKRITDFKTDEIELSEQILKIVTNIVTIIIIFILFFISYFVIRLILKSRNVYYVTLRMLGAKYKEVRKILDTELFTNASLAYFLTILIIYLSKINIIKIEYIQNISKYLNFKEYVIMYIILILMSKLISRKISKDIFKKTTINAYNDEV